MLEYSPIHRLSNKDSEVIQVELSDFGKKIFLGKTLQLLQQMKADRTFAEPIIEATIKEVETVMYFKMKEFKENFGPYRVKDIVQKVIKMQGFNQD